MYNTDRITMALTVLPGNQPITLDVIDTYFNGNGTVGALTRDQIRRAMRAVPYARKIGKATYRLKGRRVNP